MKTTKNKKCIKRILHHVFEFYLVIFYFYLKNKEEQKMKAKKLLSGALCTAMLVSAISVSAAKVTFSDVENDPTVSWAKPYISEMAELGYIKGYEDGTFKPNNTITKTEALLLLSRMLGVNDDAYADSVELAQDAYGSMLKKYSTNYSNEIAFLLYTGVLKTDDLDTYISTSNKNTPLKRYEAAVLLTKLLGAEEDVQKNTFVSSSYADTVEIPDSARAYVEYVKGEGIMQGMGTTVSGQPVFSPNTDVTRSQMAKMLCSLIDVLNRSAETGVIASVDNFNDTFTVTVNSVDVMYNTASNTRFKVDGKDVDLSALKSGMHVKITHLKGQVSLVENYNVIEDAVIYGLVSSTKETTGSMSITIVDANDSSKKQTYSVSDKVKVRINDAVDTFGKIKSTNYVKMTISDETVTEIEVVSKTTNVSGTLINLDASGEYTILTVKGSDGTETDYEVSADGVSVARNSLDAKLSSLMQGDSITLRLTYGKVTKITAASTNQETQGTISYITYTTTGTKIGIEISGKVTEYTVNKSVDVLIDSSAGSVYDLRPGSDIKIKLQSSEIVKIEAAGTITKSQLVGIVKSTNANYGLMVVEEGNSEYSVFVNGNTKIIDSVTGASIKLKSVEKGRTVTVTGSTSSGVLEASVIVVQ